MVRRKTKYAHATTLGLACLGIACAVGAAEIAPPSRGTSGKSALSESVIDTNTLDSHVGFYRLNDAAVMTITRVDKQLNAQLTGQPALPIAALSKSEFSYKDKRISFMTEPDGQTTSLILHQYGIDVPMRRIGVAAAERIASFRAEQRYRSRADRLGTLIILQ